MIPVMRPRLATFEEIAPYLQKIDQSNIYSNYGPLVRELEEAYANYLSVNKELVVALANATLAIQGLISISKIINWIVPAYTFSATGMSVLNANRKLHICDVQLEDWKLDIEMLDADHRNFGIIPVMPFGSEVKFDPYCEFDEIIIDAAASLGTFPPNFRKMRTGWAVVYSLHATKVLGAGEGAIVVCGNSQQATLLRSWGNFGFITDRSSDFIGTNAKMSEVCAAYGLFSLENKEKEKTEWLISQGFVSKHTFSSDWSTFVNSEPKFHPYWIASFENKEKRNSVREKLKMSGIKSAEWWARPLSEQKAFTNTTLINDCRNAKLLSEKHLGLPMYRGIMEEDVIKICDLIDTIT